jgi:hypothetical protein
MIIAFKPQFSSLRFTVTITLALCLTVSAKLHNLKSWLVINTVFMATFNMEVYTNNQLHSGFINKIYITHLRNVKNPVGYLYTTNTYMVQIPRLLVYDTTLNDEFFS